jgi:hypothetical protein
MPNPMADTNPPVERQFIVSRDDLGMVRIVNDTSKRTITALTRREAKQLSRELRRVLKKTSKS